MEVAAVDPNRTASLRYNNQDTKVSGGSYKVERLFEGGTLVVDRSVEWSGLRVSLKNTQQADDFLKTELCSSSHALFMGIDGALQNTIIEAEGIPRWKGIKGRGRSSFWVAGRRMRCWQSGGNLTVLTLFFDADARLVDPA